MAQLNTPLTRKAFLVALCLFCVGGILCSHQDIDLALQRQGDQHRSLYYLPSANLLEKLSLGHRSILADLIWIRALLYAGTHFSERGDLKWLPKYIDAINYLDPKFRKPYIWGAIITIYNRKRPSRKQVLTSMEILERGRKQFPDDFYFHYALGMSYLFEIQLSFRTQMELRQDHLTYCKQIPPQTDDFLALYKKTKSCLRLIGSRLLMEAASKENAPDYLARLAAGLMRRGGANNAAICQHLLDVLWRTNNPNVKEQLQQRVQQLCGKKELDAILCHQRVFQQRWQKQFPYLAPSFYALLDHPALYDVSTPLRYPFAQNDRDCP